MRATLVPDVEESDLDFLQELRSDPGVGQWLFSPNKKITVSEQRAWYRALKRKVDHRFWVAWGWNDDMDRCFGRVGYAQVYDICALHGSAEIGIVVSPVFQGRGLGTQITVRTLEYAFETQIAGLNSIMARVLAGNLAAIHMFTNCGFSVRGWLPEAIYKDGRYCDVVMLSITRREYVNYAHTLG